MPKFTVTFTEEKVISYSYDVEAVDADEAYLKAEDRYFNFEKADLETQWESKTLGHEVEEIENA
jgi:hypothetical protein